jgi:dephospho-CoA kinase
MKRVGLTGGIGSGKTTAASIFRQLGVPIYNADFRAKVLMSEDLYLRDSIFALFGSESFDGLKLNKSYVASKVFSDQSLLLQLNDLVHPIVQDDFEKWFLLQDAVYVIKEAAIIYESGSFESLDCTILVQAPEDLKIKRVMLRDSMSKLSVESRMKTQWSDEKKISYADFIIVNDEKQSLLTQVLQIHKSILNDVHF